MAKPTTMLIKLVSTAETGFYYVTRKNPRKTTNKMELRVYGNAEYGHAVAVARLDNLGKGASGAAVQNLKLMLGV